VQVPTRGVALFINAFNFPGWGLWEKAAPALLSGVPVIIKPATATAWLTQRMVKDVVDAGVLPAGALSVICGSSIGLLDQLQPFDVLSFTGSADTAELIRSHPAVTRRSVRVNIEADSLNSAWLLPGASAEAVDLLVKEVARQWAEIPGLSDSAGLTFEQRREWYNQGKELVKPDYQACIAIATKQSLQEMVAPGALVIFTPIIVGTSFGVGGGRGGAADSHSACALAAPRRRCPSRSDSKSRA
jgi:hypothetical protein